MSNRYVRLVSVIGFTVASASFVGCYGTVSQFGAKTPGFLGGRVNESKLVADPALTATKEGRACTKAIFGLVNWGDSGVEAAKKAGGVTKVASVDTESLNALGIWNESCTIVRGE